MKRTIALFVLVFVVATFAGWDKYFGDKGSDGAYSVIQTADGGFVVAGFRSAGDESKCDGWVFKLDGSGEVVWSKIYGGENRDKIWEITETDDGGFAAAGYTYSFGDGGTDAWLLRFDSDGDTIWTRTYGGSFGESAYSLAQTKDGGYVVAGTYDQLYDYHPPDCNSGDVYIVKTYETGEKVWEHTYGVGICGMDICRSIISMPDGGAAIAGWTETYEGWDDVYIVRVDSKGDTLWTRTYGGVGDDRGYCIAPTKDGGFIITGKSESCATCKEDLYLIKIDADGDSMWTRTFGTGFNDWGMSVAQTSDGGYIVVGTTDWRYDEDKGYYISDIYLLKTNSKGKLLWEELFGGERENRGCWVEETSDGGFIVAGIVNTEDAGNQVYVVRTDKNGRMR